MRLELRLDEHPSDAMPAGHSNLDYSKDTPPTAGSPALNLTWVPADPTARSVAQLSVNDHWWTRIETK